jgi:hypothetical protein
VNEEALAHWGTVAPKTNQRTNNEWVKEVRLRKKKK